ncbi:DNA polymerase III subunit delta [Vagococcus jeotgali]|uniref:DNA polymerase III subunit delta n=1 Tax=Vagococcus jeotgali TaxID=3109030 RepID=UPI002DDBB7D8|nr:DNA polymerase III subunit delta [Vagococcus sp. B2T-5]
MGFQQDLSALASGEFAPIYLLLGEERYLRERFKKELEKNILSPGDEAFNLLSFDMDQELLQHALNEVEMVSFFGNKKIVYINHPFFLTGEKKKTDLEHDIKMLLAYLKQPSPDTVLVFNANYKKLDERKKIVKELKKVAKIIDVSEMSDQDTKKYIQQTISSEGYEITREAFDLFIYLTDTKLSQMMNELDKLFLATSVDKKITKPVIEALISKSLEHSIFDLLTFVLEGKSESALRLYKELVLQGEDVIKINAILISQFRLLLQVKIMLDKSYQQANMVDVLKIHPYRVKLSVAQAKKFSQETLFKVFDNLVENDYKMKTGFMDQKMLFELFLLNPIF